MFRLISEVLKDVFSLNKNETDINLFITVRISNCGKVMFSHASVVLSTGEGGFYLWVGLGVYTPLGQIPPPLGQTRPPWTDTPLGRDPSGRHPLPGRPPWTDTPPGRHPPRRPLQRTVHILLECILVSSCNQAVTILDELFNIDIFLTAVCQLEEKITLAN